jgi:hypothetical protein
MPSNEVKSPQCLSVMKCIYLMLHIAFITTLSDATHSSLEKANELIKADVAKYFI